MRRSFALTLVAALAVSAHGAAAEFDSKKVLTLAAAQKMVAAAQAEALARISPVDKEYLPTLAQQTYKPVSGYVEATVNLALPERAKAIDAIIKDCEKQGIIGAGFHHAFCPELLLHEISE